MNTMRPIPPLHRNQIDTDPYYRVCARSGEGGCAGRITIEHVFIYAGRQICEMWNYLPLCWFHHLGAGLDKRLNEYLALLRVTTAELSKYPKVDWKQKLKHLTSIYDISRNNQKDGKEDGL